ncbi:MAG: ornithine carbamoyltransferase, partial [bacterium]|nr:ornithine carbamoyltransferase [Candidatus Kapabacteria bacterium]
MNKDLLTLFDIDADELDTLFNLADELRLSDAYQPLAGIDAALIFQKPSLRTRVSFEVGIGQMGGRSVALTNEGIGIGTRETAHDVAKSLAGFVQLIVARLYDHSTIEQIAMHADIPVVNALTDLSHPCQVLADLYTIRQHGRLNPGVTVAFVGDGNNVANSWIEATTLYPVNFILAAPNGYGPDLATLKQAGKSSIGSVTITNDPVHAVRNADIVYGDVWTSMGQETETRARAKAFAPFQINEKLMNRAPSECLVMHCLPAHRGEEITAGVIDGPR